MGVSPSIAGAAPLGRGVLLLSNSSLVELKVFFGILLEDIWLFIRDSKILKNLRISVSMILWTQS